MREGPTNKFSTTDLLYFTYKSLRLKILPILNNTCIRNRFEMNTLGRITKKIFEVYTPTIPGLTVKRYMLFLATRSK